MRTTAKSTRGLLLALAAGGLATTVATAPLAQADPQPAAPVAAIAAPASPTSASLRADYWRAVSYVRHIGRVPDEAVGFNRWDELEAINTHRQGAASGRGHVVIFFRHGRPVGSDGPESQRSVLRRVDDRTVAVSYRLYHSYDPAYRPTGPWYTVPYRWTRGAVRPLGWVPPVGHGYLHR